MKTLHKPNDIIHERYRLVSLLGEGTFGTTYEAEDLTNYQRVVVKALPPKPLTNSKVLELFEREANILASLDRPAIPKFLDSCYIDSATHRQFYLVRELIDGESLADLVKKGWHASEEEVKDIAIQILDCLEYLHDLEPPAIHRDIKPENIIRCRDGKVFLVDFKAVQEVYRYTLADDGTFAGTIGYMPPEQYSSQVKPATDIYGLGATLLFLLTHRSPEELPQHQLKLEFRDRVNVSPELAEVLEKMLEPFIEERFQSATEVLEVLKGGFQVNDNLPFKNQPPSNSRIRLNKTKKHLIAEIPSVGWVSSGSQNLLLQSGLLIGGLVFGGLALGALFNPPEDIEALFGPILALIASLSCLGNFLLTIKGSSYLEINEQTFRLQWKLLGFIYKQVQGKTGDIRRVELGPTGVAVNSQPVTACTVVERMGSHRFGMMLEPEQKEWLIEEISDFLTQLQPSIGETDSATPNLTQPRGSRVVLQKTRDRLIVDIPPTGLHWYHFLVWPCIVIYLTFVVNQISSSSDGSLREVINSFPFSAFSIMMPLLPFFLFFMVGYLSFFLIIIRGIGVTLVGTWVLRTHIEIDRRTFTIEWNCLGFRRQVRGQVAHLQDVFVVDRKTYMYNRNQKNSLGCILVEGILNHSFGSHLKVKEQHWLVAELAGFLGFAKLRKIKEQHQADKPSVPKKIQQPIGSQIKFKKTDRHLVINIPTNWSFLSNWSFLYGPEFRWFLLMLMLGGGVGMILAGGIDWQTPWQVFLLRQIVGTIPVAIAIAIGLKIALLNNAASTDLEINRSTFRIKWKALFFKHEVKGRTADIKGVKLDSQDVFGQTITTPMLVGGITDCNFGRMVAEEEKQWLIEELSEFLGFNKSRR